MTELENTSKGIDRRTLVKGAAWSVPVIAAAVATPLAAASTPEQIAGRIRVTGGCIPVLGVLVGGHTITNNNTHPVEITITQRLVVHAATGVGTGVAMTGWQGGWTPGTPNFGASTCTNSGLGSLCYRREASRSWTTTIGAGSSIYVSKILPLTLLNSPESYLTVTVGGTTPVSGSPAHYEPKILGAICVD